MTGMGAAIAKALDCLQDGLTPGESLEFRPSVAEEDARESLRLAHAEA